MPSITVTMKDGEVKRFEERGRSGGSYAMGLRYEQGFVVIVDEWGKEISIPTEDIKQIEKEAPRSSW